MANNNKNRYEIRASCSLTTGKYEMAYGYFTDKVKWM